MRTSKKETFWNKPKLMKIPRPASMLELFFDIVVVALIGGIGHKLISQFQHGHATWFSLAFIVLQTLSVLLIWRAITMYSIKFEVYDLRHRLVIFSCVLPMILMAAAGYAKDSIDDIFIIYLNLAAYAILMFAVSWIFVSAAFANKEDKFFFWYLMIKGVARIISLMLVLLSIIIPILATGARTIHEPRWREFIVGIWTLEFIIQLSADMFSSRRRYASHFPVISRHLLKERYSILYIAFLGEMIIQIVSSYAHHTYTVESFIYLLAAIFQVFLMFWIYFDLLNFNDLKKSYQGIWIYSFSMLVLFFSMLLISCGLSLSITDKKQEAILLLVIGNLLYTTISKICLFSFKHVNMERRYIEPTWFKNIMIISWFIGLTTSSAVAIFLNDARLIIWPVILLEVATVILTANVMIRSRRQNIHLTEEEFREKAPKVKQDW